MKPEAIKALKILLTQYKTKEDFYDKVRKKTGFKVDIYFAHVQAIWAVRSIINRYDKSLYGILAEKWDEKVVNERFSDSVNKFSDAHGTEKVMVVIRELQKEGKWEVPEPLHKASVNKSLATTSEPKRIGLKVVGHMENGKFVPNSPDKAIQELKVAPKKPVSFVTESNDNYEIVNFSKRVSHSSLDEYHIRVSTRQGNNYVGFNDYISNLCKDFNKVYVYFRIDKMTEQLYIVLSPHETPNSIAARRKSKKSYILYLSYKNVAEYLKRRYDLKKEVDEVKVTKNLSKIDDVITIGVGM